MKGYSLVGGVLSIISGSLGVLGAGVWALIIALSWSTIADPGFEGDITSGDFRQAALIFVVFGAFTFLIGLLAIVGGAFACRRKTWGLALAGAISSTIAFFPCGVAAIVFVALGKGEFDAGQNPTVLTGQV